MIKWKYRKRDGNKDIFDSVLYRKALIQEVVERNLDVMKYLKFWKPLAGVCQERIEELEFGEGPND